MNTKMNATRYAVISLILSVIIVSITKKSIVADISKT